MPTLIKVGARVAGAPSQFELWVSILILRANFGPAVDLFLRPCRGS